MPANPAPGGLPMRLEEFFGGLLDSTGLVVYLKDATGRYIYVNRKYELVSGAPRDFIIGKFDKDLFPPEVAGVFRAQDEEVARRRVPLEYEETLRLSTGVRSFITEKFPLIDANGGVYAVGGFCTEITIQSKRGNETLAAERERHVATLRCIGDGIISTDVDGSILHMNPSAELFTGRASAESAGSHVDEILRPAEKSRGGEPGRLVKEAVASGGAAGAAADFELVARDGQRRRIAPKATPVRDRTGGLIGVVLTLRDVTDESRLETELFQARKLESLGLLAGGIAHDFNNLLTGILGNVSIARESLGSRAEAEAALAEAEVAAHRAGRLTHQLLTFAQGGSPVRRVIDAAPTVQEAATFAARGSKACCVFEFAPHPWPISADRGQLGQIVSNLVINAVQAMPSGGSILVGLSNKELKADDGAPLPPGPYLRLTVADGGSGISQENLNRIFDPYFSTKEKGTGLGLTTSYSIVSKHGGHISVESRPGTGAAFTILLPALPDGIPDEFADDSETLWRGSGRILAMDDDPLVAGVLSRVLPKIGYEAVLAPDGAEAVRLFREAFKAGAPFAAVILDLTVAGGMGGLETLGKLRRIDPEVLAIVSSGYSRDPILSAYKKNGFSAALAKPYEAQQLSRVLHDLLGPAPRR